MFSFYTVIILASWKINSNFSLDVLNSDNAIDDDYEYFM